MTKHESIIFKILTLALFSAVFLFSHNAHCSEDKIYIDETEMSAMDDAFYIHTGDNVWISTNSIYKDKCGTFTYTRCIACSEVASNAADYQKTWKCPYCYQYWPVGSPCQNKNCPSRYK